MDQLTLTPDELALLEATEAPLAPERRLQLAEFVLTEIHQPKRSRKRTFGFLAAFVAALTLTGGVAYAWIATTASPSDPNVAYCYQDTNPDRSGDWQGNTITSLPDIHGKNQPAVDAVTSCAEMWDLGVVHRPGVVPTKDSGNPVPDLTACVDKGGATVVFPADASICTRLGLPSLK